MLSAAFGLVLEIAFNAKHAAINYSCMLQGWLLLHQLISRLYMSAFSHQLKHLQFTRLENTHILSEFASIKHKRQQLQSRIISGFSFIFICDFLFDLVYKHI